MRRCLMRQRLTGAMFIVSLLSCQNYQFVYQPDAERTGTHLRFSVQQPSKADILFVIDNSGTMLDKQATLASSINTLLQNLAPQDTSYRIGVVSTDAHGFITDCGGNPNPPVASNTISDPRLGAKGNCTRPDVALRRPHDATMGRLIAAYDPTAFAASNFANLDPNVQTALAALVPTGPTTGPVGLNGEQGARWVIDRQAIQTEACNACNCTTCGQGESCYTTCADPTAQAMVRAYFLANVAGLGNRGFGWEEGLKSAMWAVGVDPEDADDETALNPAYNLTAPGAPNSYTFLEDLTGTKTLGSWLRDDALLAVMFLTDEEDCSMPRYLMDIRAQYEEPNNPVGSVCYQSQAQASFLNTQRMAQLLTKLKGGSIARVAVGLIGGVKKTGIAPAEARSGVATDCVLSASATPSTECSCFGGLGEGMNGDTRWCNFSQDSSGASGGKPACLAYSGSRYVNFANYFQRRTYESVCRADADAFGPALADFARIATLACFDLQQVRPANNDPNMILVKRSAKGTGSEPVPLAQTSVASTEEGWYYDATNNKICLTGLDRLIGDNYDIFLLETNRLDFTK